MSSSPMVVPDHIFVNGFPPKRVKHQSLDSAEASRVLTEMHVPDRIVLGGGDTHHGSRADPTEVMADRLQTIPILTPHAEVPDILTGADSYHREPNDDYQTVLASDASIAIDENPLRELKAMRKQIGRLSTRILNLEDEISRRNTRETALWVTIIATIAVVALGFIRPRGKIW